MFCGTFRMKTAQEKAEEEADEQKMASILQHENEFSPIMRLAVISKESWFKKEGLFFRRRKTPKECLLKMEERFLDLLFLYGLKDSVNTQQQVEVALRFFPQVLSRRRSTSRCPIFFLCSNIRSVSFIPLFARLGSELNAFHPSERGGLVDGRRNVFSQLAWSTVFSKHDDSQSQKRVDRKFLSILKELRHTNLMIHSDIVEYQLVDILCLLPCFPKERFLYLVHWNPRALLSKASSGNTVSPWIKSQFFENSKTRSLANTCMLFDLLLKYYPDELGFLFDKPLIVDKVYTKRCCRANRFSTVRCYWKSSFQLACQYHGEKKALSIVDALVHQQVQKDPDYIRKVLYRAVSRSSSSFCERGALVTNVDQIFFLIQRDPTVFHQSSSTKDDSI